MNTESHMDIPELSIKREQKNAFHIYLYYLEDSWWAFGYSAFYLSMIHTELIATRELAPEGEQYIPCMPVSDTCLLELSETCNTLAFDAFIQIDAPPTTYCYRENYDRWCEKLAIN